MTIIEAVALTVFCNAVIAAVFIGANLFANGWGAWSLWLLWGVTVIAITALTVFFHRGISGGVERPNNASGEQAEGSEASPIPVPRDAVKAAAAEQVNGQSANSSVRGQQSPNPQAIFQGSQLELWFAGAVAAATIVLAVFGAYQLQAIRSQIRVAEDTVDQMRLEQRAWLGVSNPERIQWEKQKPIICGVKIRNTGRVPGTITHGIMKARAIADPIELAQFVAETAKEVGLAFRETVLAPDNSLDMRMDASTSTVPSDEDFDAVQRGTKQLCTVCVYGYDTGVKGFRGITVACYVWDRSQSQFLVTAGHNQMK